MVLTRNDALAAFLLSSCSGKEALLIGNFNLPSLDWLNPQMLRSASSTDSMFINVFDALGLTQWITAPTFPRSNNTLDLLLTTDPDRIGSTDVKAPPPGCDHCSIHYEYVFDADIQVKTRSPRRGMWHLGNYTLINNSLMDVDWDFEFALLSADASFNKLKETVEPLIAQYIPFRESSSVQRHRLPWSTNPPTRLRNKRKCAWDEYKRNRDTLGRHSPATVTSLEAFFQANKVLRNFAFKSQVEYERSLIDRTHSNPRLLHSYIRHKKQYRL